MTVEKQGEATVLLVRHDKHFTFLVEESDAIRLANLKIAYLPGLPIMISHVAGELEQSQREFECSTKSLILR